MSVLWPMNENTGRWNVPSPGIFCTVFLASIPSIGFEALCLWTYQQATHPSVRGSVAPQYTLSSFLRII